MKGATDPLMKNKYFKDKAHSETQSQPLARCQAVRCFQNTTASQRSRKQSQRSDWLNSYVQSFCHGAGDLIFINSAAECHKMVKIYTIAKLTVSQKKHETSRLRNLNGCVTGGCCAGRCGGRVEGNVCFCTSCVMIAWCFASRLHECDDGIVCVMAGQGGAARVLPRSTSTSPGTLSCTRLG